MQRFSVLVDILLGALDGDIAIAYTYEVAGVEATYIRTTHTHNTHMQHYDERALIEYRKVHYWRGFRTATILAIIPIVALVATIDMLLDIII